MNYSCVFMKSALPTFKTNISSCTANIHIWRWCRSTSLVPSSVSTTYGRSCVALAIIKTPSTKSFKSYVLKALCGLTVIYVLAKCLRHYLSGSDDKRYYDIDDRVETVAFERDCASPVWAVGLAQIERSQRSQNRLVWKRDWLSHAPDRPPKFAINRRKGPATFASENVSNPERSIRVCNTRSDCIEAVRVLNKNSETCPVLGFDCEYVRDRFNKHRVVLLQLSDHTEYCALIRLDRKGIMLKIPSCLQELLRNQSIIKLGVGAFDDKMQLSKRFGLTISGVIDLRHVSAVVGEQANFSLARMVEKHLGVHITKSIKFGQRFDARELNARQIRYAAYDAIYAVKVFQKLVGNRRIESFIKELCPFKDVQFNRKQYERRKLSKSKRF